MSNFKFKFLFLCFSSLGYFRIFLFIIIFFFSFHNLSWLLLFRFLSLPKWRKERKNRFWAPKWLLTRSPGQISFQAPTPMRAQKIKFLDNLEHGIRCREFRSLNGYESCPRICLVLWSNACWTSERSFEMRFDAMVWDFSQGSIFFFARPQRTSRVCATKRESHHCCSQVAEPHAYPLSIDRLAIFDFAFIAARSPIQKCVTINSPLINFACLAFVPKELLDMNRRAHRTCANNNGRRENRYTPRFCYDAHRTWIANRIKFQIPQEMSSKRR